MKTRTKIMAVLGLLALCSTNLADELLVPSQFPTIQAAIDDANDGDTVIVAPGTYTGPGNRDIDFLGKAIIVKSENGPENCIIDCKSRGRGFYFQSREDTNSILDGFRITRGHAKYFGGGIYCRNSSPLITNCSINSNSARLDDGGGICCHDSNPTITNCTISDNSAGWGGGGISCDGSSPTISNCTVTDNRAGEGGGGIYCWQSSLTICNSTVSDNEINFDSCSGGGIGCYSSSLTITNCTINNNAVNGLACVGGGLVFSHSKAIISNCRVIRNSAGKYGGGIYSGSTTLTISNCTISDNSAEQGGGGMYNKRSSDSTLINCILWGDTPEELNRYGDILMSYTDVQGGWEGEGNINADPMLEPDGYHLRPYSPCINAGDPDFDPSAEVTDIDGEPRVVEGRVDMGADEYPYEWGQLVEIEITGLAELLEGASAQYIATAYYDGGYMAEVTTTASWWLEPSSGARIEAGLLQTEQIKQNRNVTIHVRYTENGITADAELTIFVHSSVICVPADYETIQAAIDAAQDGVTIIVADGTYTGEGNCDIDFNGKAITVRSENGPENCIIDCNHTYRNPAFDFHSGEDANSILAGFTITNSRGAICCYNSSPKITNCIISGNAAMSSGGISCYYSSPTITNCTITDNIGSGIYCEHYSSPTITNCIISGNTADGWGGGIYCYDCSSPKIIGCIITGHAVDEDGGGIYCYGSSLKITNCTITDNSAKYNGGGIFSTYNSSIFVTNSIAWGNTDSSGQGQSAQIYDDDGRIPDVWFSCIQDANPDDANIPFDGETKFNIDYDPFFALDTDYHLMPTSPCIDAGTNDPCGGLATTDIEGVARSLDGDGDGNAVADMGAYEYALNSPSIAVSARSLYFYFAQDWPKPHPQALLIRNCGGEPLHWEIIEDCNWLQISPENGVSTSQIEEVILTVDPNGLAIGSYSCTVVVLDPNAINSPVMVQVELQVGALLRVPQHFLTIQAAIDAADNYDIILVADGTYTGEGNKNLDFRGKPITVCSENGPNNCIIDCENLGRGFYFRNQETENSIVDGFTITNGYSDRFGGGIYCEESSPAVINCSITGNSADYDGGGIYCSRGRAGGESPTIIDCIITANSTAGKGGGIYCLRGNPTITNCTITNNTCQEDLTGGGGAGICCESDRRLVSSPIISNCIISDNKTSGRGGGIYCRESSPKIRNCNITGNSARSGSGISCCHDINPVFNWNTSPLITNCTITGNSVGRYGGLYYCRGPITNCIIWENWPEQIYGSPIVTYSNVQGGYEGEGNIDADPCFIELGYWADANDPNIIVEPNDPNAVWIDGDYHLLPNSPCIDAGDPNYIPEPNETDLDGNPRVNGGRIDMGAYESIMHEAHLMILPRVINRKSRQPRIMAWLRLPQGITKDQIDRDVPLILYPGGIEAIRQFVFQSRRRGARRTSVFAFFNKAELIDAVSDNGTVQLQILGHLLEPGQYFYGSDTIRIIARRLPRRRR